jgi:hypothetical protein
MGVDSFGRCFNSASEADDPLYVKGRLGETKERISSQYRFVIVQPLVILKHHDF